MLQLYAEDYRPQIHFSAARNWINDPNGMVYSNGRYHLFYQHNPNGIDWGNMHWGHAVSTDLVSWSHCPIALRADPGGLGYMFSGSAVVDQDNKSGLGPAGTSPIVILYTNSSICGVQSQSLAYSIDDGESWTQYSGNPVIPNNGMRDFRDPKLVWHAESGRWIMCLTTGHSIQLYASADLIAWSFLSEFSRVNDIPDGVWECPDLFPLRSSGGAVKWILIISINPEHETRDLCLRYFIGDFDGTTFRADNMVGSWLDYGPDNYGAVSWEGTPETRDGRTIIGWMSSWKYARCLPTYPWRGNMTLPRELRLVNDSRDEYVLVSRPALDTSELAEDTFVLERRPFDADELSRGLENRQNQLFDLELQLEWGDSDEARPVDICLLNESRESLVIRVDRAEETIAVDRHHVGQSISPPELAGTFDCPLRPALTSLDIRVVRDTTSVEVFADGGRSVLSVNFFPDKPLTRLEFRGGDAGLLVGGTFTSLHSIWSNEQNGRSPKTAEHARTPDESLR